MPVYQLTFGESTFRMRSIDDFTSDGRTARSTGGEKRTPGRTWNVYTRPPSVIFGSPVARSGTTCDPAPPAARRNVISPSLAASRISHPSVVAESAPSRWSGLDGIPASSVPPFTGVPPPEPPLDEPEPPPQAPAAASTHRAAETASARSESVLIRGSGLYTRAQTACNPSSWTARR